MENALSLTTDQFASLRRGESLRIATADPQVPMVVVRAEQFDRIKEATYELPDAHEIVHEMYPLLAKLSPEDWEDASNYSERGK